jgi:polyhydroxybutyrate depolymerase
MPQSEQLSGAIVFAHGFGGSAQGTMNNTNLRTLANDLGVALVALQVASPDWELPFSPRAYDTDGSVEFSYVDAVLDDLLEHHGIRSDSALMAGFSAGGMLTWNLACHRSEKFLGFVPMSGTFWLETPDNCDDTVASVYHFHGSNDAVVPFEGRQIRNTHQGSITDAIAMYRQLGDFNMAEQIWLAGIPCDIATNDNAQEMALCTFQGGHAFRAEYIAAAWERLNSP